MIQTVNTNLLGINSKPRNEKPNIPAKGSSNKMTNEPPNKCRVAIVGGGVIGCSIAYHLGKIGWEDTVVWNPYGNDTMGHRSFICVEAARAACPVELVPGEGWHAAMSLRASK